MLSRLAIKTLLKDKLIEVEPLVEAHIGPNSIDLRLGDSLKTYHPTENRIRIVDPEKGAYYWAIDPKNPPPLVDVPKTSDGRWLLVPGRFYLGVTLERTRTQGVVAHLDGRSTCGRLSIEVHKTAGVGDNGFNGRWTLEIEATEPVLVGPGDRLLQVYFTPCWGNGLALLLRSIQNRDGAAKIGSLWFQYDNESGPLLDIDDLYGGQSHHYQGSGEVEGAAPLGESLEG